MYIMLSSFNTVGTFSYLNIYVLTRDFRMKNLGQSVTKNICTKQLLDVSKNFLGYILQ